MSPHGSHRRMGKSPVGSLKPPKGSTSDAVAMGIKLQLEFWRPTYTPATMNSLQYLLDVIKLVRF